MKELTDARVGSQVKFDRGQVVYYYYRKALPNNQKQDGSIRTQRVEEVGVVADRMDNVSGRPEYYLIISRDRKMCFARANEVWGVVK